MCFAMRSVTRGSLTQIPCLIAALLCASPLSSDAQQPELRLWKDRANRAIEAVFLSFTDGQVQLRKKDDEKAYAVPLASLSDYDQKYVELRRDGRRVGEVPEAVGSGLNPEEALQSAYSAAIEQAVGVLVDAETKVEDDKIIHERILTYSQGYVEKFDVLKRGEEGGTHRVAIRALVAREKLAVELRTQGVSVREFPGERMILQFQHKMASEEDAAEMLRKALADCTMDRFWKADPVGEPEPVQANPDYTVLRVKTRIVVDRAVWSQFQQNLRPLLQKIAEQKSTLRPTPQEFRSAEGFFRVSFPAKSWEGFPAKSWEGGMQARQPKRAKRPSEAGGGGTSRVTRPGMGRAMAPGMTRPGMGPPGAMSPGMPGMANEGQLPGSARGPTVYLLNKDSPTANETQWDVYQLPETTLGVFGEAALRTCQLRVQFLDAEGRTVVYVEEPLSGPFAPFRVVGPFEMPGTPASGGWSVANEVGSTWNGGFCVDFMPKSLDSIRVNCYCVSPFVWVARTWGSDDWPFSNLYSLSHTMEQTVQVSTQDLRNVAKSAVSIVPTQPE